MVSVVTLTFNNFEELTKTLSSLPRSNNIESIVVNGGTCERTRAYLASYAGKSISEPDRGISDAFNKGLSLATGDAVAFLNSGDLLLEPGYYERADHALQSQPEIDFIYSSLLFLDSKTGPIQMNPRGDGRALGKGMPFPHPTLVVRKEVFSRVGGFSLDYKIAMDFDFVVRMMKSGARGKRFELVAVQMDGSGISSARELQGIRECKKSLLLHHSYDRSTQIDYGMRILFYYIRRSVSLVLGAKALQLLKLWKNRIRRA